MSCHMTHGYRHWGTFSLEKRRFSRNKIIVDLVYLSCLLCALTSKEISHLLVHCFPVTSLWLRDTIAHTSHTGRLRHLEDKFRKQSRWPTSNNLLLNLLIIDLHNSVCLLSPPAKILPAFRAQLKSPSKEASSPSRLHCVLSPLST